MKTIVYIIVILFLSFSHSYSVELEGGIFHSGSTLQIKIKPTGGSFNSSISQVKFAIKYLTSYSITFSPPVNYVPNMSFTYDQTKTSDPYTYQFYVFTGSASPNWGENSENLIMEVTISGGTGTGDFFLVSGEPLIGGSNPNWYAESLLGVTGGFSVELYQSSTTDAPLPVELSSFTALAKQNVVNLKWETKTEINNFGFEVRKIT
jgi:hypothetical protein